MVQVQLDLLERPLDQEARECVRDRAHASQSHPAGHADQHLLADPEVHDAVWMPLPGGLERISGDIREHYRHFRIGVEQFGRDAAEALSHGLQRDSLLGLGRSYVSRSYGRFRPAPAVTSA